MRSVEQIESAVAKLDTARLRRVGQMLVTQPGELQEPERVLLDVAKQNAKQLLTAYHDKRSRYATAPFDSRGDKLRFYPGGITIWSGYPGAGKSTALRELTCHLMNTGHQVFVASFEEDPADLLIRTAGTAFGREVPDENQLQWFIDWYAAKFRVWGTIGIAKHRQILGTVQELAKQGIDHVVIDSLMCLDIKNDDFEAQRQFANLLAATARSCSIHIHLVAHPRKVISADQEPDINDVGGAREIGGIGDNVIFVRRGKVMGSVPTCTAMQIMIRKQRHEPGTLGEINGWFNRHLRQFKLDQFDQKPTQYLPKVAYDDGL